MSKTFFTISLPHDKPDGSFKPQFFVSCNNNTVLSFKGIGMKGARWGNSNESGEFKNRFEYSVTASGSVTRFSLIVNTSFILPPLSWTLPTGEGSKKPASKRSEQKSPTKKDQKKRSRDHGKSPERSHLVEKQKSTQRTWLRDEGTPTNELDESEALLPDRRKQDKKHYASLPPNQSDVDFKGHAYERDNKKETRRRRKKGAGRSQDPGFNDVME